MFSEIIKQNAILCRTIFIIRESSDWFRDVSPSRPALTYLYVLSKINIHEMNVQNE